MRRDSLTNEYIRGLTDASGSFTFHTNSYKTKEGIKKVKIPAFIIQTHAYDTNLISGIKKHLNLPNKIYKVKPRSLAIINKGSEKIYKRGVQERLCVRELGSLKNIIVPLFYKKLFGYKHQQYEDWIYTIGHDPEIREKFKIIYRLYKSGFYDSNLIFD